MATSEASQQANRAGMDPRRLVVIFYMLAAFVVFLFLDHVLANLWATAAWSNPEVIEGVGATVTTIVALVLALGLAVGAWAWPTSRNYSMEVSSELMKVTWPSWEETRVSTVAVVVASILAAILLFGIDSAAYQLMVEWLPRLWGKL